MQNKHMLDENELDVIWFALIGLIFSYLYFLIFLQ